MGIIIVDFKKHSREHRRSALKEAHREDTEVKEERKPGNKPAVIGFVAGVSFAFAIGMGIDQYYQHKVDRHNVQVSQPALNGYLQRYIKESSDGVQRPLLNALDMNNPRFIVSKSNWAGYAMKASERGAFKGVSTIFKVPTVISHKNKEIDVWTGLGGSPAEGLIQAGVAIYGNQVKPWIEELPKATVYVGGLVIKHGDEVIVSIKNMDRDGKGRSWDIKFVDINTGKSFSEKVNYKAAVYSAECVVEKPWTDVYGKGYTLKDMPDFGTVSFSSCTPELTEKGVVYAENTLNGASNSMRVLFIELLRSRSGLATTVTGIRNNGQFDVNYVKHGHG